MTSQALTDDDVLLFLAHKKSPKDLSGYCTTLLKLFDRQMRVIAESTELPETKQFLIDAYFSAFIDASLAISKTKAKTISDIIQKVSVWRRLAPESFEEEMTPDELLMTSIIQDIKRLGAEQSGQQEQDSSSAPSLPQR